MMFVTKQAGLLRSARRWGALGLVLALAVVTFLVGYGQRPAGPIAVVTLANQQLRQQVASVIPATLEAGKIKVSMDDLVFASREDVIVILARRLDLDKVGPEELKQGAVLGVTFLAKPDGSAVAKDIPAGFYIVKAIVDTPPGAAPSRARIQLIDQRGQVVLERLAEVGKPGIKGGLTVSIELVEICLDYHWSWGYIKVCIGI